MSTLRTRRREYAPIIHILDPQTYRHETTPGFYSDNTFQIDYPEDGAKWLSNLTAEHVQLLRKISCHVPAVYNPGPFPTFPGTRAPNGPKWCAFLRVLAMEATGLVELKIYFDCDPRWGFFGAAVDVNFVRALGYVSNLKNLRTLKIGGYFAKEWPQYLEEKTGLKVWEETGQEEQYLHRLRHFQGLLEDQRIEG